MFRIGISASICSGTRSILRCLHASPQTPQLSTSAFHFRLRYQFDLTCQARNSLIPNGNVSKVIHARNHVTSRETIKSDLKKPDVNTLRKSPPPRTFCEMSNEDLMTFAVSDHPGACEERLVREIMAIDNVTWDDARPRLVEIRESNIAFGTNFPIFGRIASSPYMFGTLSSVFVAFLSIPLCFHVESAKVFNANYVTADVADEKDLETWLEVGSWTWSWMEPVLGQISFVILCFVFARNQMLNLGWRPYSHAIRNVRSRLLQRRYPQYNSMIIHQFSITDDWYRASRLPFNPF